jgi:uracil-DNA glycosylase family 4
LTVIQEELINCFRCPRLVEWREGVAKLPPKRYAGQEYWARPIASMGEADAQLIIVGLAPAAHGGNRTGRVFTGDRSGDWLFRALWKVGFANQPTSVHRDDGLRLINCYITAACHCAPPDNKPTTQEFANCRPYLLREFDILFAPDKMRSRPHVLLGLGKIGFDACWEAARDARLTTEKRPKFGHGAEAKLSENLWLLGTYHPSQQNTFTGKLTEPMFDAVFTRAREILNS